MTDKWYAKTADEAVRMLKSSAASGLSSGAAKSRLRRDGINNIFTVPHVSASRYAGEILGDLTAVLFIITVAVAAIFGEIADVYVIGAILILSCILEVATYIKAQRVLEKMASYSVPAARVLRDGRVYVIDSRSVVCGDILLLEPGEAVPCDCRVISVSGKFSVSEKGITSNKNSVRKFADAPNVPANIDLSPESQTDMLFGGSVVVSGQARAAAVKTGEETLVWMLRGGLPVSDPEKLTIIKKMKKYCHVVSLIMISAVMVVTMIDLLTGTESRGLGSIFITGMSLAVASMSEFFTAVGYIIIACSVVGDKNTGAKIKKPAALKILADTECVIMSSNTVLRSGKKQVKGFYFGGKMYADFRMSNLTDGGKKQAGELMKLINLCLLSLGRTGLWGLAAADSDASVTEDLKTVESFCMELNRAGIGDEYKGVFQIVEHIGVSASSKFETTLAVRNNEFYAYSLGDISKILAGCKSYRSGNAVLPLTRDAQIDIVSRASSMERTSCRVVAVAGRKSPYNNTRRISVLQTDLCFEGFIGITDPITSGGAKIISSLKKANIRPVMVTEDTSSAEKHFAVSAGFIPFDDDSPYITGAEFKQKFKDTPLDEIDTSKYNVLAGFDNADLAKFIEAEKLKNLVTYAGAGRGDTELITLADTGFACSQKASQTAKVSAEALYDISGETTGGIHDINDAICRSKGVFFNLKHTAAYIITSQTARFMLVLLSVIFRLDAFLPQQILSPQQILIWGLIFDFLAVLIMAFEKPKIGTIEKKIPENTPLSKNEMVRSVIFGLLWAIITVAAPVIAKLCGADITEEAMQSCIFISSIISLVFIAAENAHEKSVFAPGTSINVMHLVFLLGAVALIVLCVLSEKAAALMRMVPPTQISLLLSMIPPVTMLVTYEVSKRIKRTK